MKYVSLPIRFLLQCGTFLMALLITFSAVLLALGMLFGVYSHTEYDTVNHLWEQITLAKCRMVKYDYFEYGNDISQLFYNSKDYRGMNNFRFTLYITEENTPEKEVVSTYADEDYLVSCEHTGTYFHEFFNEDTQRWEIEKNSDLRIVGYYCPQDNVTDIYTVTQSLVSFLYSMRIALPIILAAAVLLWAVLGITMTCAVGHSNPDGSIHLTWFDRIPYDLCTTALFGIGVFPVFFIVDGMESFRFMSPPVWKIVLMLSAIPILLLLTQFFYSTTVARIKSKTVLRNTLVWLCVISVFRGLRWVFRQTRWFFSGMLRTFAKIPAVWQAAVTLPVILCLNSILISLGSIFGFFAFLAILFNILIIAAGLYAALSYREICKSGQALAGGNLTYKTDTERIFPLFREHAENLNAIGFGMERAVEEKMKSERFKTELITNVSHDIKTPLTSIINYTDLLAKENLPDKAREYTEILSRHSARLKKLTEDLIEASKASTGNIPVSPERLSICQIVRQSVGEYEMRMEQAGLTVMTIIPPEDVYAMVDGRLLWRVLDNLYSNVCKYALTGTRVYIIVAADEHTVCVSVKNISRDVLNVASDELTERFIQGDKSRASEGSGLGLNIAKSLVELQHGKFTVHCDGDLFRCDILFPIE